MANERRRIENVAEAAYADCVEKSGDGIANELAGREIERGPAAGFPHVAPTRTVTRIVL